MKHYSVRETWDGKHVELLSADVTHVTAKTFRVARGEKLPSTAP